MCLSHSTNKYINCIVNCYFLWYLLFSLHLLVLHPMENKFQERQSLLAAFLSQPPPSRCDSLRCPPVWKCLNIMNLSNNVNTIQYNIIYIYTVYVYIRVSEICEKRQLNPRPWISRPTLYRLSYST